MSDLDTRLAIHLTEKRVKLLDSMDNLSNYRGKWSILIIHSTGRSKISRFVFDTKTQAQEKISSLGTAQGLRFLDGSLWLLDNIVSMMPIPIKEKE